jgi:hypothetical protein
MLTDTNSIGKRLAKTSFALSAFALVTIMAAAAIAAPPLSEATKSRLANGHWGGKSGAVWIAGAYEKPYNATPPLAEAAKAKLAKGRWGGKGGNFWISGSYEKPYNANPQISETTREKMSRGYSGGNNGNIGDETGGQYR